MQKIFGRRTLSLILVLSIVIPAANQFSNSVVFPDFANIFDISNSLPSALVEVLWNQTYGGTGDDRVFHLVALSDGYLLAGSTTSFGEGNADGWIMRIDLQSDQLWNKTYGGENGDEFRQVLETSDGFLLVGNTFSFGGGQSDGWIVKTDKLGNHLWNKTFGNKDIDKLLSASQTLDGFVFAGFTYSYRRVAKDAWVLRIDSRGNILWNTTLGPKACEAHSIIVTTDYDYVVAGYINSSSGSNFWLAKIHQNGSLVWEREYGYALDEGAYALLDTGDGYLIVGHTKSLGAGSTDALIVKTDLEGNVEWETTAGGADWDLPNAALLSKYGGYLIAGYTFSFGEGERDFWFFKLDSEGNMLWSCTHGGVDFDEAYSVVETGENEFVAAGWTSSFGKGQYDFYVVKLRVVGFFNEFYVKLAFFGIALSLVFAVLLLYFKKRKSA